MQTVNGKKITQTEVKRLEKLFSSTGFKNRYKAIVRFVIPFKKNIHIKVNLGGGSYTDGKTLVIGLPEVFWTASTSQQVMAMKALAGHEAEHIVSSDFYVFRNFQEEVYKFFKKQYNLDNGRKLGAQMLNAVEDGRIEKRLVNRLKGMKKYIQYLNGSMWDVSPVTGEHELMEYTLNVCYMATSGVWMKDFDEVYGGTRMEEELEKVKPLIVKAINEPTAKGCADRVFEIIETNADFLAELLDPQNQNQNGQSGSGEQQDGDPTDQLDRAEVEYTTTPPQNQQDPANMDESSHFVPEEENEKSKEPQSQEDEEDKGEESNGNSGQEPDSSDDQGEEESNGQDSGDSDSGDSDEEQEGDAAGKGEESDEESEGESDGNTGNDASDDSDEGSEGNDGDSEGSDENQGGNDDASSEQEDEEDASHPEEHKSVDDLIREAVEDAEEELEYENQQAVSQSIRENKQEEREEARREKVRQQTALSPKEEAAILNLPYGPDSFTRVYSGLGPKVEGALPQDLKRKGFKFHKDLEKIFLDKKGFTRKNRRKGMLDTNALWRMTSGDTDVFIEKGRPKESDYVVSILLDNSGSMSEQIRDKETGQYFSKSHYAKRACVVLEEGLNGILPFQIAQFDYGLFEGINHRILRGFEETSKENRTWENMNPDYTGGGNGDGYSIKIAHRELMKRPERKKVLFVLSDGEPSAYNHRTQAHNHVREAVEEARRDGVIVIAIRFGVPEFLESTADTYKKMYGHSYIACEPAEIQKELLKTLKKAIK